MEPDDFRSFHRFIEVAIDGLFYIGAQLLHGICLGVDSQSQGRRGEPTVHLIFLHQKNEFAHGLSLRRAQPSASSAFSCPRVGLKQCNAASPIYTLVWPTPEQSGKFVA